MLKRSSIFFMSPRSRKTSIAAEDIAVENTKKNKAKQIPTPHVGPRLKLYHYIFDEGMSLTDATEKVISEFPSISVDDITRWYNEKTEKERSNLDEGR